MKWFMDWFKSPLIEGTSSALPKSDKVKELEEQILRLEKEVVHWKRIALEFKRHH